MPSPIVFHSMTSNGRVTGDGTFKVPRPDNVHDGDLLVMAHVMTEDKDIPGLPGWEKVSVVKESGMPALQARLFSRTAKAEPEFYEFTDQRILGPSYRHHLVAILRYTGNVVGQAFNRHTGRNVSKDDPYVCPDVEVADPYEVVLQVVGACTYKWYSRWPFTLAGPGDPWRRRVDIFSDSTNSLGLLVLEGTGKPAEKGPELVYTPQGYETKEAYMAMIGAALNPDMNAPVYDEEGRLILRRQRAFTGWGISPGLKAVS